MRHRDRVFKFFLIFVLVSSQPSWAKTSAYMEAGLAFVGQFGADYRGSEHYQIYALPLPYFMYHGSVIKVDKEGVRGELWANDRVDLSVSMDASLHSRSDHNKLREGMPKLNSAVEIGPSLNVLLYGKSLHDGWSIRLPVRAVFTVGSSGVEPIGYLFNPRLTWRKADALWGWRMSASAGLLAADSTYHAYYYDVATDFATQARPYYEAGSGYSGLFTRLTLSKKIDHWRFGFALRYDYLDGATFMDSPLVETKHYASASFGVTRSLWSN